MKLLWINACPRDDRKSRTARLSKNFLLAYQKQHPEDTIMQLNLKEKNIACYTSKDVEKRDALVKEEKFDDPMFAYARQFKKADKIVISAPYWDLSFPAVLKVYIESICACGVTFRYLEGGIPQGLCNFQKILYITTAGGVIGKKDFGSQYIKAIAQFLGNGSFLNYQIEGLDMEGIDAESILGKAESKFKELAKEF